MKWKTTFAGLVAASLKEFRTQVGETPVAMFAVDCHPWNAFVGLAVLTQPEVAADPLLLDPAEMAAWSHYEFSAEFDVWAAAKDLEAQMGESYSAASDKPAMAACYFQACAEALATPEVQNALDGFVRTSDFQISVVHPDTDQDFYSE